MDVDVSIDAMLDLHRLNAQSFRGRKTINVFFRLAEPPKANVGDVWVKSDSFSDVVFSENQPSSLPPNKVWQKITGIEYEFDVKNINAFIQTDGTKLYVNISRQQIIDQISSGKVKLWDSVPVKAYAELNEVMNFNNGNWNRVEAFMWTGTEWFQISNLVFWLYEHGTEHIGFAGVVIDERSTIQKNDDHIYISSGGYDDNGAVTTESIDLTGIKKVCIEWETYSQLGGLARLNISTRRNASSGTYNASLTSNNSVKHVDVLDVSSLTGNFYIRFHAYRSAWCRVYKIWLEY